MWTVDSIAQSIAIAMSCNCLKRMFPCFSSVMKTNQKYVFLSLFKLRAIHK